ncbi:Monovalent cation: proton antiporter-2 (CPA2) family transporter [Roseivivax marinus]|uniref:Monovalent cation: proton antiporter-2 (CPA2) family transporter n=1 Tax=Roseivivax marinus TaxID=1379903 RepID=W4HQ36_9RHOB|nr:cation:proton antiporter [Roseivivax marinus]ETW14231.1 Monovalent cation: proton antiporter-2 (CPA2) family transporter [Roseivivax marinus]
MEQGLLLITLGLLFLSGLIADRIGHMTSLPRVTMLLLLGLLAGQSGFDLLPDFATTAFEPLTAVALTMVAFLLGGELTRENLTQHGRAIVVISLSVVVGTTVIVWGGLTLLGMDPRLALLLGAAATATDPAAIADVIHQSGVRNRFTETLSGIVAVDDIWGVMIFALCLAMVQQSGGWLDPVLVAAHDIGGALLLGAVIGIPAAFLTGRLEPGEPQQTEAIGVVFLTTGLALWLEVSFLLAGMTAGALVANFARHHEFAFNEIENIEWPFMILFFLMAGATLDLGSLSALGWTVVAYIVLRVVSRVVAGEAGARLGRVPHSDRHLYGPALLPQAGVAVGMALVAAEAYPAWGPTIMTLTIAATVFFEVVGPPCTLVALRRLTPARRDD